MRFFLNGFPQRIGDDGAAAIFLALRHNSRLQMLCLDRNGLTDACCGALQELLLSWDIGGGGPAGADVDDKPLPLGSSLDNVSVTAAAAAAAAGAESDEVLSAPSLMHEWAAGGDGDRDGDGDGDGDGGAEATKTAQLSPYGPSSHCRKKSSESGKELVEAAGVAAASCKLQLLTLAGNAIGDAGARRHAVSHKVFSDDSSASCANQGPFKLPKAWPRPAASCAC